MDTMTIVSMPQNDDSAPAGAGHNNPPAAELAAERVAELEASAKRWLAQVSEIADPDTAARANEFINQLADAHKEFDQQRKQEKRPHDQAALDVQKRWLPLLNILLSCRERIDRLHRSWLQRENARLASERNAAEAAAAEARRVAERAMETAQSSTVDPIGAQRRAEQAAEEAAEAARRAAAVPDRARTRGALTGRARSLRIVWSALIIDQAALYRHYAARPEVKELLQRMADADARHGIRQLPGCKIFSEEM